MAKKKKSATKGTAGKAEKRELSKKAARKAARRAEKDAARRARSRKNEARQAAEKTERAAKRKAAKRRAAKKQPDTKARRNLGKTATPESGPGPAPVEPAKPVGRRPTPRPAPRRTAVTESADTAGGASAAAVRQPTRAELYRRAQELDVAGRSTMTRDELAAAVTAAGG